MKKIADETYGMLRTKYGQYGSWALWHISDLTGPILGTDCGIRPLMKDLADPLYRQTHLTGNAVVLGCNGGSQGNRSTKKWSAFHSTSKADKAYKLARMLMQTPFEGAYMTNVLKSFSDMAPSRAVHRARQGAYEGELVTYANKLQEELDLIQPQYLILLGKEAYQAFKLLNDRKLLKITNVKLVQLPNYLEIPNVRCFQEAAQLRQLPLNDLLETNA
ncbi:uracil-DNA glycosylase family protein [Pediococcus siamensis]|uniref:uracil-DNA glycosylase family protein n=1 Tax=Pediococcus siamensis TaxID=381829 RepID=UPI00399F7B05